MLALYLDLAPYGGNIEGIRAASLTYFGKEPRRLSLGEAALLVALPQSPENRRPDRSVEAARQAQRPRARPLRRTRHRTGRRDRACQVRAGTGRPPADADAGAACGRSGRDAGAAPGSEVRLTHRCRSAEEPGRTWRGRTRLASAMLGPDVSLAMLVVDNASGEVRARVGRPITSIRGAPARST